MTPLVDILLVTCNNPDYLSPCVISILETGVLQQDIARLIIINNGRQPCEQEYAGVKGIVVLTPGENLGWEGALQLGLKNSTAQFVVFQNDDTFIPYLAARLYQNLLHWFRDPKVAAVGPVTTVAAGLQSIYHPSAPRTATEVSYLIFFTVMIRRAALDAVGGVDTTLPGGDDFDLSIRLRNAGYKLVINPAAFLIHHGFVTGTKLHGNSTVAGGWNSKEMSERTNQALIRKHGFRTFFQTVTGLDYSAPVDPIIDTEGVLIHSLVNGFPHVLELGCGAKKTVAHALGVDRIPKGIPIPHVPGQISVADVVCDVQEDLPFPDASQDVVIARHILEHCVDAVQTLTHWHRVLRPGGQLILAVPDESLVSGILMNPEHVHAFTQDSLSRLVEKVGFKTVRTQSADNGVSFVGVYEKTHA